MRALVLFVASSWLAGAATSLAADARAVGAAALKRADAGRFEDAVSSLRAALAEAREDSERAILLFHLGYVHDGWATADPTGAEEHLRGAEAAYRRVLHLYPKNRQAAQNLALVLQKAGTEPGRAEADATLRSLAAQDDVRDDGSGARALVAIGDQAMREGRHGDAMAAYWRAAERELDDEVVQDRVIDTYERWRDGAISPEEMLSYCDRLASNGFRPLATRGFAALIRSTHQSDPPIAEAALLRWTEERLGLGTLTGDALAELPATERWKANALEELRSLMNDEGRRSSLSWWMGSAKRAHVAASIVARRAEQAVADGAPPARAAELYERAMEIAPDPENYGSRELAGRDPIRLDAAVAYARLLHAHQNEIDPEQNRVQSLVDQLFNDKMLSYANRDLRAIRRYHVTLGLILAGRGQWMDGGIAQLRMALDREGDLARSESREPRPQPELRLTLARGLEATGSYDAAFHQSVDAAKDAMTLRDDERSVESIERARSLLPQVSASTRRQWEPMLRELDEIRVERRRFDSLPLPEKERELEPMKSRLEGDPVKKLLGARWVAGQAEQMLLSIERDALKSGDRAAADRFAARAKVEAEAAGIRPRTLDPKLVKEVESLRVKPKEKEKEMPPRRGG